MARWFRSSRFLLALVAVLAGLVSLSRAQMGGLVVEPSAGQRLVWEFVLDAKQRNDGRPNEPAIESRGSGVGRLVYDTSSKLLQYELHWSDLEGEVTGVELRGPARAHQSTARRLTEFPSNTEISRAREGHMSGEHVLREQVQPGFERLPTGSILIVLVNSGGYLSIQTTAHPRGEIRGNVGHAISAEAPPTTEP